MMMLNITALIASLVLGACGAIFVFLRGGAWGLNDFPGERSSHSTPVPKGGGIGILAAFVVTSLVFNVSILFWGPVAMISCLGFAGDRWEVHPLLRLVVQFSLSFIFFASVDHTGYGFPDYLMTAFFWSLFLTATANFYNFMDGINGMAGFTGVIAFGLVAWWISGHGAGWSYLGLSGAVMLACAGFLPWNFPSARVFMGDGGSLLLGFLFGGYVCCFSDSISDVVVFVSFLFPFYADTLTTLAVRIRDKENILEAHRRHLYQLLVNEFGIPHWKVTLAYGGVQLVMGISVLMLMKIGVAPAICMLTGGGIVFCVISGRVRKQLESSRMDLPEFRRQIFSNNILFVYIADLALIVLSFWVSCTLRFGNEIPSFIIMNLKSILPLIVIIKLFLFSYFDFYRGMWRYTSFPDIINIVKASFLSLLVIISSVLFMHGFNGFPRSVFVLDCMITALSISVFRLSIRFYFEKINTALTFDDFSLSRIRARLMPANASDRRLLIVGAGDCGEKIYREIQNNPAVKYKVVGFLDDDPAKIGRKLHGIPVLNAIANLDSVVKLVDGEVILIAAPSASAADMKRIIGICEKSGLPFKILPNMGELINGNVAVGAIRDVSFRDLLGRPPVSLDQDMVGTCLDNRRILVTGAGGSIGSELCRQICRFKPDHVITLDRAETPLFEIDYEIRRHFPSIRTTPVLVDIQDKAQVERVFKLYSPEVVFHAAAYKHVVMLEGQPWKAVMNNISGTVIMAEAAKDAGTDRFVYVSTDKAVMPTSIMGASKRIAEMFIQNQKACHDGLHTKFMTVRFGNVAGSAGSVVPIFKKQIREGGPVTVTHPEVTRFFMTIPEACQLILQAGAMGKGREIFLLDMGTPIKILDMARELITLYGLEPEKDIKIEFIGLRKGEKLFEELVAKGEDVVSTSHQSIMVLESNRCSLEKLHRSLNSLFLYASRQDEEAIIQEFQALLPDYTPSGILDSFYPPN